jgi:hypothetical protein
MKEESAAHDINPEQLKCLFGIGRDTKDSDQQKGLSRQKADMLSRSLSQPLPLDKSQIDVLPSALGQLCHSIGLLAGEAIGELLSNPSTGIAAVRKIKHYSKQLSAQAKSTAENDVAIVMYYAAIAHALVFHGHRITRFSFERLDNSFSCLIKERWISRDLSVLLKAASKYCKEKARS